VASSGSMRHGGALINQSGDIHARLSCAFNIARLGRAS
jgi:hypothetical protein